MTDLGLRHHRERGGLMNDADQWMRELEVAGWTKVHRFVWRSPDGDYYPGPYRAWCVMRELAGRAEGDGR